LRETDEEGAMQRDLVIRAQRGDHEAFTALIGGSLQRWYSAARLILRRDDLAEDAVQEALVKAWVAIRGLRDPDRFDAWVHRLLVHACYRAARLESGRRNVEVRELEMDGPRLPDAQHALAMRDLLERGFRQLSPDQRAVLVAHYYLDLSDTAAAEALDIPTGTLKSRLNRATVALRAALEANERQAERTSESIA
jgi:RNA polymerase sigma-70 factor (ECF subfamily)